LDPAIEQYIGDPRTLSVEEFAELGHHRRPPLDAVRQNCIKCCAGSQAEVPRCRRCA